MTTKEINSLKAQDWLFETEHGESHHNGDPYTDYSIRSPRLETSFSVFTQYDSKRNRSRLPWDWMTKAQMLARETLAYAQQRVRDNESAIEDAVEAALVKNPDAKRLTVTIKLS